MSTERVERIGIGDGTPEGQNSAYLVDERVVVDPGPPTDDAWRDLQTGLEDADITVRDLESVLVTHWHVDHAGLAPRLAAAADATLAMGAGDAPLVADYASERDRRLERDRETMSRLGAPDEAVGDVIDGDSVSAMPDSVPVARLADGDRVSGLEVVGTPGHTLGHTAFAGDDVLLVGDTVLPTYTPNVGGSDTRTLDVGEGTATTPLETDPLTTFLETLDRLEGRSERLLPGHGTTIESGRIAAIRSHHEERSRRVREALEYRETDQDRPGTTVWTLALDLFGDLEGIHVKFGVGEVAAHCQRLERDGVVERLGVNPVRYGLLE